MRVVLELLVGALVAEHAELLQYPLLAGLRSVRNVVHSLQPKGTRTPYYVANIILFTNVVQQKVPFWPIILHPTPF